MIFLKAKRVHEHAKLPSYATAGSAGLDLTCPTTICIYPDTRQFIPLGIAVKIPMGYVGILSHRSGHNKNHGLFAYGVIDSDFVGELGLTLFNNGVHSVHFKPGDRIAQLVLLPIPTVVIQVVEELPSTRRGEQGWGHTDKQEVEQHGSA